MMCFGVVYGLGVVVDCDECFVQGVFGDLDVEGELDDQEQYCLWQEVEKGYFVDVVVVDFLEVVCGVFGCCFFGLLYYVVEQCEYYFQCDDE